MVYFDVHLTADRLPVPLEHRTTEELSKEISAHVRRITANHAHLTISHLLPTEKIPDIDEATALRGYVGGGNCLSGSVVLKNGGRSELGKANELEQTTNINGFLAGLTRGLLAMAADGRTLAFVY